MPLILALERRAPCRPLLLMLPILLGLTGCATLGSMLSPYSEKFSCKNEDHGQCIHPDQAYQDAVAGRPSRSDPAVTHDRKMLRGNQPANVGIMVAGAGKTRHRPKGAQPSPYLGYRDSVYRALQGLIDQPVTPMLRSGRTVRTMILPYAPSGRPDRLYMPRYVFSIVESPQWVVGAYLVDPVSPAARAPVLGQVREKPGDANNTPRAAAAALSAETPAFASEPRP